MQYASILNGSNFPLMILFVFFFIIEIQSYENDIVKEQFIEQFIAQFIEDN